MALGATSSIRHAEPIEEAAECCNSHQGKRFLSTVQNVASACGCVKACEKDPRCTHFSHSVAFGVCVLCSGCVFDAIRAGGTSARYSSWALIATRDAASLPQPLAPQPLCRKLEWPVIANMSVEKKQGMSVGANRSEHPLAEWLGRRSQSAQPAPVQLASGRARCVSAASEEAIFRRRCSRVITAMDAHLAQTTSLRRGLFIEFVPSFRNNQQIGWGHALAAVYALHWLCRRVGRRCFLKLFDYRLGTLWNYANGAGWDEPNWSEWPNVTKITYRTNERATTFMPAMLGLLQPHANASLVHLALVWHDASSPFQRTRQLAAGGRTTTHSTCSLLLCPEHVYLPIESEL